MSTLPRTKELMIRKSNTLLTARYKLTAMEMNIMYMVIALIDPNDADFKDYSFNIKEFAEIFGLTISGSTTRHLLKAASSLVSRYIELEYSETKVTLVAWLTIFQYERDTGKITVRFEKALKPYLLQLHKAGNYTKFPLSCVALLRRFYSKRLYELLREQFYLIDETGEWEKTFTIPNYRSMLGILDNEYPLFANFRVTTIDNPIKDINENSNIQIYDIKYHKEGRNIVSFTLFFRIVESAIDMLRRLDKKKNRESVIPYVRKRLI